MIRFPEANNVSQAVMHSVVALALAGITAQTLLAVSCTVAKHNPPSDADKAMLSADYEKAATLYKAALEKQPGDPDSTAGLVHALLRQQNVPEASDAVNDALTASPKSAAFITLRGEVELRQGEPWLVEPTVIESYKLDPCNARTRLLYSRVLEASFRYATARQQVTLAHQFDPADQEIRLAWIKSLPLAQRIAELESYLSAPTGDSAADLAQLHVELDRMKKEADAPPKACHLTSPAAAAEIPFIKLAGYAGHPRGYGIETALNGATTRLQVDTRGAGISVYRAAAERAGLKRLAQADKGGAAPGAPPTHLAYADTVRLGGLEFHDCTINVIDSASPFDDGDGQIGIDVFSDFMVTLDFPMRKVALGPLPARPSEPASTPSLKTDAASIDDLEPTIDAAKPADAAAPASHGPYDRFLAPEMKDYTQIYHVGHDLIFPAALNGEHVKLFIMDASIGATNISAAAALDVAKVHEDKTMEHPGPGGTTPKIFVADEITFNFAHVSQKLVNVISFNTSDTSKADGVDIAGFLGMNTLSLLTLHIDYRDGLLKAEYVPGRGYKFE